MTDLVAVWAALPDDVRAELIAEPEVVPFGRVALLAKHGVPLVSVAWEGQPHDHWEVTGEFLRFLLERAAEERGSRADRIMAPLVESGKVPLDERDPDADPGPLSPEELSTVTALREEAADFRARAANP